MAPVGLGFSMRTAIATLETLLSHPAPGVVFSEHDRAGVPCRAHPSRHQWRGVLNSEDRATLDRLVGGNPALSDLKTVYERSDGVDLFYLKCPNCDEPHWALSLLPVSQWHAATAQWKDDGNCAWLMKGGDLYQHGEWRVIASMPSEEMRLVQFFSGEFEGKPLAGRIYCIGLDGYLAFDEEVAPNLSALLEDLLRDPAAFFERVGFSWTVDTGEGHYGDPIDGYVADVRGHPNGAPWPPTRPLDW
jgi:hypothetical protein